MLEFVPWAETEELLGILEALAAGSAKGGPGAATRKFWTWTNFADCQSDVRNAHIVALQEAATLLEAARGQADGPDGQQTFERMVPLLLKVLGKEIHQNHPPRVRPTDEIFAWLGERMLRETGPVAARALAAVRLALRFAEVQRLLWIDGMQDICDESQWRVVARGLAVRHTGYREGNFGRGPLGWLPDLVVMERDGGWVLHTELWLSEETRHIQGRYELGADGWAADADAAGTGARGPDPRLEPFVREGVMLAGAPGHGVGAGSA